MTRIGAVHPRAFFAYAAVSTIAAAILLLAASPFASADPVLWPVAAALLAVMIATEAFPPLRPDEGRLSTRAAWDAAALLLLGGPAAAWLAALSVLAGQGALARRAAPLVVCDAAAAVLAVGAAGGLLTALGAAPGASPRVELLAPAIAAALAYLMVHALTGSLAIGLWEGPGPRRVAQRVVRHSLLETSAFYSLGAAAGAAYLAAGAWTLPLFALPYLAARRAIHRYAWIRHDLKDFVRALAEVLDEVDPYTRQHSARVAEYAVRIARALRLPERDVEDLEYAALVHDLGKIGPEHQRILNKAGSLSVEEQRTLRSHPAAGAGILAKVRALRRSAEIVRLHHERPDGRGYPFGLRSEHTPLPARILNVADAFDAMTSDRPYRRALEPEAALRELDRGAGVQFDREVVRCLRRLYAEGRFPLIPGPSSHELLMLRVRPAPARA